MDPEDMAPELLAMASMILLLMFHSHQALCVLQEAAMEEESVEVSFPSMPLENSAQPNMDAITSSALQQWRIWNTLALIDEDLGFWVKPRSTAWFTRFMMHEYGDSRWIQLFRMTKRALLALAQHLAPAIRKKDTRYRAAVPVIVRLACTLFKLSHGATLLICSELFAVGRSTVSIMLRQVVHAINVGLKNEIRWPFGEGIPETEAGFRNLCGLPGVLGAIDGTHFSIGKPQHGPTDYFYFKAGAYSMHCQAVVDSNKRFLDLYVGMLGSANDARVLRRSTLFH